MGDANRYKLSGLFHTQHSRKCSRHNDSNQTGLSGLQKLVEARGFYLLHTMQIGPETHTATLTMGSGGQSSRGVALFTHCYLVARLRMSGATPLIPLSVPVMVFYRVSFTYNISQAGTFSRRNYLPISG